MNRIENINMYKKIFDICTYAFEDVKFNKLFLSSKVNNENHIKEVHYREMNVMNAFFDLKEAEGMCITLKK